MHLNRPIEFYCWVQRLNRGTLPPRKWKKSTKNSCSFRPISTQTSFSYGKLESRSELDSFPTSKYHLWPEWTLSIQLHPYWKRSIKSWPHQEWTCKFAIAFDFDSGLKKNSFFHRLRICPLNTEEFMYAMSKQEEEPMGQKVKIHTT